MLNGSIQDLPTASGAEALEAGAYPARVVGFIDIGNQDGKFGVKHQIIAQIELPTEQMEDDNGEPRARVMSYFLNVPAAYTPKSKLCQLCDLLQKSKKDGYADYLGRALVVDVSQYEQDGKSRNRITSASALTKGMDVAEAITPLRIVSDSMWDDLESLDLPEWIVEMINKRVK